MEFLDGIVAAGLGVARAWWALLAPTGLFLALALFVQGRAALRPSQVLRQSVLFNVSITALNAVFLMPIIPVVWSAINQLPGFGLQSFWTTVPSPALFLIVLFVSDFFAYWRHRLEHSVILWPVHSLHHSDPAMNWTTLERFHPINRLTTYAIDTALLALLGFPPEALAFNALVRHYYGFILHMDLPWTYGPLGRVFVSPVMHRWHHAQEARAFGSNFASIFSIFDRAFKTHYCPGVCDAPLGVEGASGNVVDELIHPFRPSSYSTLPFRLDAPTAKPAEMHPRL